MKEKNFACFILSNRRSEKVLTYKALRTFGYTGKIYILIDDEDPEKENYIKLYKDEVIIFSKKEAMKECDTFDNFNNNNIVLPARNICVKTAKNLKIKYFLQLDDDYKRFRWAFDNNKKYITVRKTKELDKIFDYILDLYKKIPVYSIALSQDGDFIGGENSTISKKYQENKFLRKVMNSFFCSTDRQFNFFGRLNEDVNTYSLLGSRGFLFLTLPYLRLRQITTQINNGGLTDIYKEYGTDVKSFYSLICCPSFIKISQVGCTEKRLHHKVKWENAVPQIISEEYKK